MQFDQLMENLSNVMNFLTVQTCSSGESFSLVVFLSCNPLVSSKAKLLRGKLLCSTVDLSCVEVIQE